MEKLLDVLRLEKLLSSPVFHRIIAATREMQSKELKQYSTAD